MAGLVSWKRESHVFTINIIVATVPIVFVAFSLTGQIDGSYTSDNIVSIKSNEIKAIGLCDSNNLCGALEFSEIIAKSKTQPIIGTQVNIKYKGYKGKIPLFAKNLEGYKNLIKLSSK